jgi:transposase
VLLCRCAWHGLACTSVQFLCPVCDTWKAARHKHGSKCNDCHHQQQRPPADTAAAVAAPPARLFPPRAGSHAPLPLIQRVAVVVLHKQGLPRGAIAQQAGTSLPSVHRWVDRFEEQGSLADQPRSGRPRCTDEATDTALAFVSRVEPFATPRQLKRKLQLEDVSPRTIDRRLLEAGLPGRVARHVFQLTAAHKRARLSFANGYKHMSEDDWCRVLFADVKTFEGVGHHGQVWVRRPVGEAANPEYSVAHKPHPVTVPAWGCFSAHGPGYMAMFEGSLDAAGLRDIFRDHLLPTVQEHFGVGADWWLLHDNDPGRHKSQLLRTFMHNHYIRPLDFPPYSPDLNPIENVWADMDKSMASTQADNKKALEELVTATWAELTQEYCNKMARSMAKRIAQVIERQGAYTDY